MEVPTVDDLYRQRVDALISIGNLPASKQKIVDYSVYKQNHDPVCTADYTLFNMSFSYDHDAYWNYTAAIPAGASVLVFTGYLDPATPPKYAVDENVTMEGTNKVLVEFPFTNHGIMDNTPLAKKPQVSCGTTILASYLAANGDFSQLQTTCIAQVERLNFSTWSVDDSNNLFGSDSRTKTNKSFSTKPK
ncbi:hypothetical protein DYB37_012980 [Aphanomyces astaci]|uniref:Peptidase S33 tripeptidyl aminopeptidase-like C-terminal domain-containing protein n=1 Tax=Aphanomyces astaci TaxID=112090 RepID=A0A397CHT3_APHAT|nr:hypothetical protein DYB25_010155 [Aphanomyces astaci]RHY06773.1 hypothetical protein DYB36_014105 [Aphanomyces astaci]RHY42605.1 hypothetical protein DYB38_013740 [Aphanomyces astaci]RHY77930.1 hypothetical protein DYB30_014095 [Aphanomyces astaci]RHY90430.1 hypothetical protein DYB35_004393 [Aphanomyces astaci]